MSLKISRILHAGYVFESDQTMIAFDPIFENPFSKNCYAFPEIQFDLAKIKNLKFNAIFISHFHDDHCSFESLDLLDRRTPIYLYCVFEELFSLTKELGFKNVYSLKLDQSVQIGALKITPRRALDAEVDSIFQIQTKDLNVLNVVDSWIDDETLDLLVNEKPWDMILWPFQTMREIEVISPLRAEPAPKELPPEWIQQLKLLDPKYVVPSSCQLNLEKWSWYNHAFFPVTYKQFQKEIEQALPKAKIARINPSASYTLTKDSLLDSKSLDWITPIGDQDVDYDYISDFKPPETKEIAKKFAALTKEQTEIISHYCESGLIEKYKSMDPPNDDYFIKSHNWQLSVYDHLGSAKNYYYKIKENHIELLDSPVENVSWLTEVIAAKMYGALVDGESLTSMYMRINDKRFSPEIEKDIELVDIVEDPLIRCLFTGSFASYQRAQLKRIQERNQI